MAATEPFAPVPRAAEPFVSFGSLLRAAGFAVAPEQTQNFVAAVGLLGPRNMSDIYHAALATLAPAPDRREVFDALYRAHFLGQSLAATAPADDDVEVREPEEGEGELFEPDEETESGGEATALEVLTARSFAPAGTSAALAHFRRHAPARLPKRISRRLAPARRGDIPDLRRALRATLRHDGELITLPTRRRRLTQRRIVLLIDVSGSMSAQTEPYVRFGHALQQAAQRAEVFTLGTRLTRITRPLRHRNANVALTAAGAVVADWDGGTRLGDALAAFLRIPRYAGFARSALVVVLSDGLERGEPDALIAATERLSRLAHQIVWLSPLAPGNTPQTEALAEIAPMIGGISDGSSTERIVATILDLARR